MSGIWYMLEDHNRYVYHYTCANTLTGKILPHSRLRFSRFSDVNDPRESKDWSFGFYNVINDFDHVELELQLNKYIKHSCRIGCFVTDVYEALVTPERENQGEDIMSAPYERGHSRPRMWAQYAESSGGSYSGACMVFDQSKLNTRIQTTAESEGLAAHSGKVVYKNPYPLAKLSELQSDALMFPINEIHSLGREGAFKAHVEKFRNSLFFTKALDWEHERELRWVISGNVENDFYVNIQDSLIGIALGDGFPDRQKRVVLKYAERNNIRIAIMNWRNGFPQPSPIN
jgi:Protein of unknown function (DUF2971)